MIKKYMNSRVKNFIKFFIPPVFLILKKEFCQLLARKKYKQQEFFGWTGNYASWNEAKKNSSGYEANNIVLKVQQAINKVKSGEMAYERDSVVFDKIVYSWPILSGLLWVANLNGGKLHVCDFGGSLGSTYFQNKNFLNSIQFMRWNIVEQKNFVDTGKKYFEDKTLQYYFQSLFFL
jgi:putative methyltransferase (TIGR04325 family)